MAKIITIANQKGGTGKTTLALALAYYVLNSGNKVLCVDLDSQGNFTEALGGTQGAGSFEAIKKGSTHIQVTPSGLHLLAGSADLRTLKTEKGSALRLKNCLKAIAKDYDYIIIDTPPSGGELQYNALLAADKVIVPLEACVFGLQGFRMLAEDIAALGIKPELYVVIGKYNARTIFNKFVYEQLKKEAAEYKAKVLGTIRAAVCIQEAEGLKENFFKYEPKHPAILELAEVCKKTLGR